MKPVLWLDRALDDLRTIGAYIAQSNLQAAYRVVSRIKGTGDSLADFPERGRPGRVARTRELVVPDVPYILPYQITEQDIRILAVMHTSRKWPDTFPH
jgi:addiction module RelE/StbE family toxin